MNHGRYQKEIKKWESKRVSQGLMPLRPTLGPALQAGITVGAAEGEGMARKEPGQGGACPRDGEHWKDSGYGVGTNHTQAQCDDVAHVGPGYPQGNTKAILTESRFSLHSTSQTSNILGAVLVSLLSGRLRSCRVPAGAARAA